MKKACRVCFRVGAAIALLIPLVALLCLDLVDYTPYFREGYYTGTATRFREKTATNTVVHGNVEAGFGRKLLTPSLNAQGASGDGKFSQLPLAGYGDRDGKPATGVHDDLFVKAVAVRVRSELAIFFGADALIIPREIADGATAQLSRELGVRREQLYFSATHTHCSLGGWGEGLVGEAFAGDFNPGARIWFIDCIVTAAKAAFADLQPASHGSGRFEAPEFVRNRLVGELGKVDSEFSYAIFKQNSGRIAVLGSYSAHATVLSAKIMEFSGDYPGYWQRAVEQATGGLAVFLAGAVGSHGPVPGRKSFEGAERMGQALATELLEQLPTTHLTNSITLGVLGLEVGLPALHVRLTDGLRLRPWISRKLLPVAGDSFVQGVRMGSNVWLSTPCDFSGELALEIKDLLRARHFDGVITSFNGDYVGYVIPSRYYHMSGYEPRVMSFYGPNVPEYLDELLRKIALDLVEP